MSDDQDRTGASGSESDLPKTPPAEPAWSPPADPTSPAAPPAAPPPAAPPPAGWGSYPAGGPGPYPYPPPPQGTNGFAIASFVLGILGGILLSVIFGFIALSQIKKRNQGGRGLAIAGLVISGVYVVIIAGVIAYVVSTSADRDSSGQITGAGSIDVDQLQVGDCVNDLQDSDEVLSLPAVPCSEPHEGEVFASFDLAGSDYPGEDSVFSQADEGCASRFDGYAPDPVNPESIELFYLYPTTQSWALGDHEITCIATDSTRQRTGSLRD